MIEEQNKMEEDDNLFTIFGVFDPENNGFVEGQHIKRSLQCLADVPAEDIDEIIQEARITDDKKISLEGTNVIMDQLSLSVPVWELAFSSNFKAAIARFLGCISFNRQPMYTFVGGTCF